MKKLLILSLIVVGCVSTQDKQKISYQAARLNRAVNLIDAGQVTSQDMIDFIKGERREWNALNFSINDAPLPLDLQPSPAPTSK